MATFHVDSEAVLSITGAAQATLSRLQSDAAALTAQLNGLQSSWSGGAATAFQGVVSEWQQAQLRLEEVMAQLHQALSHAAHQYAEVELANARMFQA